MLDPRHEGGARIRGPARQGARALRERARDRDARVLREAAHDGRLEGAHQRSAPRQQLQDQRWPAHRARAAAADQRDGAARRHRVPRHDQPAVHRRPDLVGRDRRAHDRIAGASRARVGAVVPGRLQERHRRQREDRGRRDQGRVAAAPFPVGDEGRPLGDRVDGRQRGLPRDPARRQGAELRRRQRERRVRGHRQGGPRRAPDDRREPREQLEEAREPDPRVRGHRPPDRGGRRAHRRRDGRVAPRRRPPGPEGRLPAHVRAEHYRRVHQLGRQREGARRARRSGEGAAHENAGPNRPDATPAPFRASIAQEKARRVAPGFFVLRQRTRAVRRCSFIRARPSRRFPSARAPARRRARRAHRVAAS